MNGVSNAWGGQIDLCAQKSDLTSVSRTGSTNTGSDIPKGIYFYLNDTLVKCIARISAGAAFQVDQNYTVVTEGALNEVLGWTLAGTVNSTSLVSIGVPAGAKEILAVLRTSDVCYLSITIPIALQNKGISLKNPADTSKELYYNGSKWKVTDTTYFGDVYYR